MIVKTVLADDPLDMVATIVSDAVPVTGGVGIGNVSVVEPAVKTSGAVVEVEGEENVAVSCAVVPAAGPFRVIVQFVVLPPTTGLGLSVSDTIDAGMTVRVAL